MEKSGLNLKKFCKHYQNSKCDMNMNMEFVTKCLDNQCDLPHPQICDTLSNDHSDENIKW